MVRIIPWNLPSINGGSEGGYTPQPTPEPTPEPQVYYDADNVSIVRTPEYGSPRTGKPKLTISGLVVGDLTGAASVSLYILRNASTSQAAADAGDKNPELVALSAAKMLSPNGEYQFGASYTNYYWSISKVYLIVYNANGEILDTVVLTEDLDGE